MKRCRTARGILGAEFATLHAGDGIHFLEDLLSALLGGHDMISSILDIHCQKILQNN
jgi:hypothetical protein